jgi:hypothetical protein
LCEEGCPQDGEHQSKFVVVESTDKQVVDAPSPMRVLTSRSVS